MTVTWNIRRLNNYDACINSSHAGKIDMDKKTMTYKEKKLQEFEELWNDTSSSGDVYAIRITSEFLLSTIDEILACLPQRTSLEGAIGDFLHGFNFCIQQFEKNLNDIVNPREKGKITREECVENLKKKAEEA